MRPPIKAILTLSVLALALFMGGCAINRSVSDSSIEIEESEFLEWWNSLSEEQQKDLSRNKIIEKRGLYDSGKAEEEEERAEKHEEKFFEGKMSQEEQREMDNEVGREKVADRIAEKIKGKGERAAEEAEVEAEYGRNGAAGERAKAVLKSLDY